VVPYFELAAIVAVGFFAGAIAIKYYVVIRRPSRRDLDRFSETLPDILRFIYFNPTSAFIYTGDKEHRSWVDYLVLERHKRLPVLLQWTALMTFAVGVFLYIDLVVYQQLVNIPDNRLLYDLGMIIVCARASFFGSKIKRTEADFALDY
jgi:hypothetical protein